MQSGKIILLNGTSSSGKSSLAKALQVTLDAPFLHIDGDYFWQLYPRSYFADKTEDTYRGWRNQFLPACYLSLTTFVQAGVNIIVDEVLTKPTTLTWLQAALSPYEVVFVGLDCGLAELERREIERGNRKIGLARFQYPNIHIHGEYDIKINTELNDSVTCAQQIKQFLKSNRQLGKFQQAKEKELPQ